MELRKLLIYLIFAATVVYGVHFHFFANRDRESTAQFETGRESKDGSVEAQGGIHAELVATAAVGKGSGLEWKRDPFKNDGQKGNQAVRKITPEIRLPAKPKVSAISRTGGQVMVVANGRVIRIGEKTGPWRLVDVGDEAALFDGPGGLTWIRLGGSK